MVFSSKTVVFLSLITAFFIIARVFSFGFGVPLGVFFGVFFSYFVGSICIVYVYFLATLNIIVELPLLIEFGPLLKQSVLGFSDDAVFVAVASGVPDYWFTLFSIGVIYFAVTSSVLASRRVVKRLRLVERFGGIVG